MNPICFAQLSPVFVGGAYKIPQPRLLFFDNLLSRPYMILVLFTLKTIQPGQEWIRCRSAISGAIRHQYQGDCGACIRNPVSKI